ncbi:MAG: Hpt domain-containing protein [Butyrivibrio sp.]|nr:Hpt domain-containing protein [Butyrivibrio sp.]
MDANMKNDLIEWGVDWDDLSARFMNNDNLIAKFMFKFIKDQSFSQLTAAIEANSVEDVFKAVHTLKGVSGNLGLKAMLEPVVNLTEITRAGSMEGAREQYELIKEKYEPLMEILNKYNV